MVRGFECSFEYACVLQSHGGCWLLARLLRGGDSATTVLYNTFVLYTVAQDRPSRPHQSTGPLSFGGNMELCVRKATIGPDGIVRKYGEPPSLASSLPKSSRRSSVIVAREH